MNICEKIRDRIDVLRLKLNRNYRKSNGWIREAAELFSEFMDAESAVQYAMSLYEANEEFNDTPQEAVEIEMSYWD